MILALTFEQEIWKSLITAVATGLFVTAGAGIAVWRLTKFWEAKRENFEIKTKLIDSVSRSAQRMFVVCQHTRRVLRENRSNANDELNRRRDALLTLDDVYRDFSVDSAALETVLGSRYGVCWAPPNDRTDHTPTAETDSTVFWMWHQIRDLLTVYYFNVKGRFPGDVLKNNSRGTDGKYHSGLDLEDMMADASTSTEAKLSAMRTNIRKAYTRVLPELVKAIINDKIKTS